MQKETLYNLATDKHIDLAYRYEFARELQERRGESENKNTGKYKTY